MPHVKIGYLNRFRRQVRTFLGAGSRPPCFDKIVQWIPGFSNGLGIDKAVKGSGSEVGREGQNGAYLDGNLTRELRIADYPSTAFTYTDFTTRTTENGTTDGSGDWLIPTNGVADLTIDGYTFYFEEGNSNNVCIGVKSGSALITAVIINATGADRISTTDLPSDLDTNGYVISDGATLYYDDGGVDLIPADVRIPVLNGTTQAYLADGTQPSALDVGGFSGPLKANVRVVDGVVYQGKNNSNWVAVEPSNAIISSESIEFLGDGTSNVGYIDNVDVDESTDLLVVFDVDETTVLSGDKFGVSSGGDGIANVSTYVDVSTTGEKRIVFTTKASFSASPHSRFLIRSLAGNGEDLTISNVKHYKVEDLSDPLNPLTSPLPESGEPVSGNSLIQEETKYDVVQADLLTTVQMFNHDNPDAVYPVLVAGDDFIADDNDVRFNKFDENGGIEKQGTYNQVLTSPCLEEVQDSFSVHIPYSVYNDVTGEYDTYVTDELIYNVKAGS